MKLLGLQNYINGNKNKMNKKKISYSYVKLRHNINRNIRTRNNSQLNSFLNKDNLDNYNMCGYSTKYTKNWWDCGPNKIKIFHSKHNI